jgi:hypothetical protein
MKLKCPNKKCKYEWDFNGKSKFYTSCPRCLHKVKIREEEDGRKKERKI